MDQQKLQTVVEEALAKEDAFLVELRVSADNKISVFADCDTGISLQKLKQISRAVEGAFDREVEDYALQVSSPGMDQPFKVFRQYQKRIGSTVKVTMENGEVTEGILKSATPEQLEIEIHERVKKETGKGYTQKTTVQTLPMIEVKETKLVFKF